MSGGLFDDDDEPAPAAPARPDAPRPAIAIMLEPAGSLYPAEHGGAKNLSPSPHYTVRDALVRVLGEAGDVGRRAAEALAGGAATEVVAGRSLFVRAAVGPGGEYRGSKFLTRRGLDEGGAEYFAGRLLAAIDEAEAARGRGFAGGGAVSPTNRLAAGPVGPARTEDA